MLRLLDKPGPQPRKSPEILARWWQEKCHERNSLVSDGERNRLLDDTHAKPKGVWFQNQPVIPLVAFFLKSTPSDVDAVKEDRPMTKSIALPILFFGRNEFGDGAAVLFECEERHMFRDADVRHMRKNLIR